MLLAIAKKIFRSLRAALFKLQSELHRILIAEMTLGHLQSIRNHEFEVVTALLPQHGKLLEIGAGTGWQARAMAQRGYDVSAVDLAASNYAEHRVFPVCDYDGHTLPFGNNAFDIIYSSNLLEHIPHLEAFQLEIHRVLRAHGCVIHVLPSSNWRIWTNFTHLIRYRNWPHRHGEHAANAFDEIRVFSRREWRRIFLSAGWIVTAELPNRLFYTGNSILDSRLGINMRKWLSRLLGSSCNIFVLREPD